MQKRFVIGDIHGRSEALIQCLTKSKFDYDKDLLIVLGDIVDGGYNTYQVIEILLKIKNCIYVIGNHDCLDEKTECLTKRGWLKYNEIKEDDIIYSYDIENDSGVWLNINEIIIKPYKGDMISVNGIQCDMLVTPNHRIFHKNKKEFVNYTLAKNLKGGYYIPVAKSENLNEYNLSDNIIKLCAWILTDGSVSKNKNHNGKIIYQSKMNYIKEIRLILNILKFEFTERIYKTKKKIICGRMMKNEPKESHVFYIKSKSSKLIPLKEKYVLPEWAYKLSNKQFNIFLKTLIKGDGTFYKNSMVLYGEKIFLEQVQILCVIKGCRAYLSFCKSGNYYRLNITKTDVWGFDTSSIKKRYSLSLKNYNGMVWCLNVPLSNFMVKRNGKINFTGNCWFLNHIKSGWAEEIWLQQGGANTLKSYGAKVTLGDYVSDKSIVNTRDLRIPVTHQDFLNRGVYWYELDNMIFVHAGFNPKIPKMSSQSKHDLIWDRNLIEYAKKHKVQNWKKVFVGHTTTQSQGQNPGIKDCMAPIWYNNLCMMDCGAGWNGKLAIMDIDTNKYWVSSKQKPSIR